MYCALSDLRALLTEQDLVALTNDSSSATEVDEAVVEAAIEAADALIDGHLGVRFRLPVSPTPTLVRRLSARLARVELYQRRPGQLNEWLAKDLEAAMALLQQIACGELELGLTPAGAAAAASPQTGRQVRIAGRPPVFGRGPMDVL
jgi:phage gp36-like protein